jgi:hydrocephalus-inducing protein
MTGKGKGPQAALTVPEMDIGDVFVNFQMNLNVAIENEGEIDCHYKLIPYETPFGSKFHFSKTEGVLGVKDRKREAIDVKFKSDILGEFSETFRFALEGSSEMLTLTYKGHVVAPTFTFSKEIIDFSLVSFQFKVDETVKLTNTSDVEINYLIRVPSDGRTSEFTILNDKGRLQKDEEALITIEFIPQKIGEYDMVLVVDLEGVGQDMLAVPIKARCQAPSIEIDPKEYLEFDEVFLHHPITKDITLRNTDSLKAKFEIKPQEESFKQVAIYKPDIESGVIGPKSNQVVKITLQTKTLHQIRVPINIQLIGQQTLHQMTILASSVGPKVETKTKELDYKTIDVLKEVKEKFTITNNSKIPADYTAFTKNKESIWKVMQRSGTLQPEDTKEIEVICVADEAQKFSDTLHVVVNNGVDLEVALKAVGRGTTLVCSKDLRVVDFGTCYTHQNKTLDFFLENRGRRTQKVKWER